MYIQSIYLVYTHTELWYNEVTRFLKEHEFKICKEDECIL
jgi:hypothetical protein